MSAYYNEIDPYAAAWLRNLIAAGHIAKGDVDERSIEDVIPSDLSGYTQCHFFAGIGGWSAALRIAGWPDDRPVWTGSCPCQPFSAAGKQRGSDDERHLWPAFFDLIRQCGPGSVFGEQVAGAAGLAWLDHVCADLEGAGYAAAAADLPACSVGAPHRRQRLFWVAQSDQGQRRPGWAAPGRQERAQPQFAGSGDFDGVADAELPERRAVDVNGQDGRYRADGGREETHGELGTCGEICELADAAPRGFGIDGSAPRHAGHATQCDSIDAWANLEWINCTDGKTRPTQPGLFPLAYGVSNRVGRLRAYGNAIVPQVAAVFVMANAI